MNQILSTGETTKNSTTKYRKENKYRNENQYNNKASTKSVVMFFAIVLILMGICICGIGAISYSKNKDNSTPSASSQESEIKISAEKLNESTIALKINHDKEIKEIEYSWNGNNPVNVDGVGKTDIELQLDIPDGTSTLNVKVTDVDGNEKKYSEQYNLQVSKPVITLEQVSNNIQITVESEAKIKDVAYYWDNEEKDRLSINDYKTRTLVEVLEGEHELKVVATDINGNETTKTQKIIGDNKPVVKVTTDGQKFKIKATDDTGFSKIVIKLNDNDEEEKEIDGNEYYEEIDLEDGENKLTVTIYNKNGIATTSRVKTTKK